MKKTFIILIFITFSSFAHNGQHSKKYEAVCRAGALSASFSIDTAKRACKNLLSLGMAKCMAGALSASFSIDSAKRACRDVSSEEEGICRAGALSASFSIDTSRRACNDFK